jgi:hypothetical protein
MSFFDSEILQEEMQTTSNLVELLKSQDLSESDRIETMQTWIDKTKIFYTRLTLTDNDEAMKLKKELDEKANLLGFSDTPQCLNNLQELVDAMKTQ